VSDSSPPMLIIGLMSGTSVDGIDAALVELDTVTEADGRERLNWTLRGFTCVPWPPALRAAILEACRPDAPVQFVTALNYRVGEAFADAAKQIVENVGVSLAEVDCIASHGQTIWHQPTPFDIAGQGTCGTLQIGEPSVIAARTGCLVVADFRAADMAVGGQGAPLVPFADYALFHSESETRVIQNIGGIANLTYLPEGGTLDDVIAFDTGPGNMLLDGLAQRLSGGSMDYDRGGAWAARGHADAALLEMCLQDPYFALPPPKTTGREQFGREYAERLYAMAQQARCQPEDIMATATRLTADTIARAYRDWLLPKGNIDTVIAGGGGTHNQTLMQMLAAQIAPARLTTHVEYGLPDDAKEAVAFSLLAYETLHGRPSNVPGATGAKHRAILGKIVLPPQGWNGKIAIGKNAGGTGKFVGLP
jgi:anhydro-N-acetylmuramic acid kinase